MGGFVHYKRHEDDEFYDRVEIVVVPRWKESDMSGDEWRVSARLRLWRKGTVIVERPLRNVRAAAALLPWLLELSPAEGFRDEEETRFRERLGRDDSTCHQPGCGEPAVVTYALKREFSREGFERAVDPDESVRRAFCERHRERGDCGLEDSDTNYVTIDDAPAGATEGA